MGTAAKPTRVNRTITVDFQNETTYVQLLGDSRAFVECVLAFVHDTVEGCSWAHVFREAHMLRRVSPVIAQAAMRKQCPTHRHINH